MPAIRHLSHLDFFNLYKLRGVYYLCTVKTDFEPIPPDNQMPLQEKIDNNLVDEIKKLKRMQRIEKEVLRVPDDINSLSADEKTEYKQILLRCKEELKDIKLYISLNDKLNRLIDKKLEAYK